jgi:hypothetical protein
LEVACRCHAAARPDTPPPMMATRFVLMILR